MSRLLSIVVLSAVAFAQQAAPLPAAREAPASIDVAHLVGLASRWTARFDQSLSGLLFRERYLQSNTVDGVSLGMEARQPGATTPKIGGNRGERLLEANVFLLRAPSAREFVMYRDVYRAGGRDVTDHTERLQQLLTEGSASALQQARRLTDASARHNLGGVSRNINIPTMAFEYLTPAYVGGLRVRQIGRDIVDGLEVVIVEFEEIARPTVVRGTGGGDVPASGQYWIHPGSGAVPRVIAEFVSGRHKGRMEVRLVLHEVLKVWVPKEMTEAWQIGNQRITGLAQYDNFKRLAVTTAEAVK